MDPTKIGIYLNAKEGKLVRITSPYWIPEAPDWVMVSNEPNATLVTLRETVKQKRLMADTSKLAWGNLPIRQ